MAEKKDNLQTLYDNVKADGWDLPDYKTFEQDMKNEENLQKLYDNVISDGWELPEYSQFKTDIYGKKKVQEVSESSDTQSQLPETEVVEEQVEKSTPVDFQNQGTFNPIQFEQEQAQVDKFAPAPVDFEKDAPQQVELDPTMVKEAVEKRDADKPGELDSFKAENLEGLDLMTIPDNEAFANKFDYEKYGAIDQDDVKSFLDKEQNKILDDAARIYRNDKEIEFVDALSKGGVFSPEEIEARWPIEEKDNAVAYGVTQLGLDDDVLEEYKGYIKEYADLSSISNRIK